MPELTLHVHVVPDEVLARVQALEARMATADETLLALSDRLNAATNEIAADLQRIRDQMAALGEAVVAPSTLNALDVQIARLELMGQDPANPVPPAVP